MFQINVFYISLQGLVELHMNMKATIKGLLAAVLMLGTVCAWGQSGNRTIPKAPPVGFDFSTMFVEPEEETVKSRSMSGTAYLDYRIGQWNIEPNFGNNASELAEVRRLMEEVRSNPDAKINKISITGYASVDGNWQPNEVLAQRRAIELKDYIRRTYGLADYLFTVESVGEDWEGLEELVSASNMAYKQEVLDIIRNVGIFQGRERELMELAGGDPYRHMKSTMFPQLRRSVYRLDYTIRNYTVEESREGIESAPENLSLEEMYLVASELEPDTEAYHDVFVTAAEVYRDSDVANLNAAASALRRRDTAAATRYLDRVQVQSTAYWNNAAALKAIEGDEKSATEYFTRAQSAPRDTQRVVAQPIYKTRAVETAPRPVVKTKPVQPQRTVQPRYEVQTRQVVERAPRERRPVKPLFAVNTNLLYDAATAINLGAEFPIGKRVSIGAEVVFPWWLLKDQRAFELLAGTLDVRIWLGNRDRRDKMTGWFVGPYGGAGYYDIEWKTAGRQGEFWHVGAMGGFAHKINRSGSLRLEYTLGLGYLNTDYRAYKPMLAAEDERWHLIEDPDNDGVLHYYGPTRVGVSLVWLIHTGRH